MRVRALVVAATATLIGLTVALPTPSAHAAGTQRLGIQLFARGDVGPMISVALLDDNGVDVLPTCGTYIIPPDYFDWSCGVPEVPHTLVVTAPARVSVELECQLVDGSNWVSATGSISIPAGSTSGRCLIYTTPDTSWPSITSVVLQLSKPANEPADAYLALVDSGGAELTGCVDYFGGRWCTEAPYGTYSLAAVGLSPGAKFSGHCRATSTSRPPPGFPDPHTITIDPSVTAVSCSAIAARPQVEITGQNPWSGPLPTFALRPTGGGDDVPCVNVGSWRWTCLPTATGTYVLVTDLMESPTYPKWYGCDPHGGTGEYPGTDFPPTFVFAEGDIDWYTCGFVASGSPAPDTTVPGTDDGNGNGGVLVVCGNGVDLWLLALALVAGGAAMLRLARRPVR